MVRWTASIPSPYEESHARTWIELHDAWREAKHRFPFAVVDPDDNLLGCISVQLQGSPVGVGNIGYWMAPWARNRGAATAALEMLTEWSFSDLGLEQLDLVTLVGNVASERVAQKAGFEFVEELPGYVHPNAPDERGAKHWMKRRPAG